MDVSKIEPGKVYADHDGVGRYVVAISAAEGRRAARVRWRRPGRFATKVEEQTLTAFAKDVRREDVGTTVDPAPALPNNGMSA